MNKEDKACALCHRKTTKLVVCKSCGRKYCSRCQSPSTNQQFCKECVSMQGIISKA